MSTDDERQLVVEYWFRILIGASISVSDISNIINEFGKVYDKFDPKLSSDSVTFENNDSIICTNKEESWNVDNAFGTEVAKPGKMYHWKLKLLELGEKYLNVGIIEADKCKKDTSDWWNYAYGFSYYTQDGNFYNKNYITYGEECENNDIIDIWLDLRENKNELSFARNDKQFGKAANTKDGTDYKLVIGAFALMKKVEILMFEIK